MSDDNVLKLIKQRNKIISISEWLIPFICGFISYGLYNKFLVEWYHYVFYCIGVIVVVFSIDCLFRFIIDLIFKRKFDKTMTDDEIDH